MKVFLRTVWGKTLLFTACILAAAVFAASAAGAVFMLMDGDMNFYTHSEAELGRRVTENIMRPELYSYIWDAAEGRGAVLPGPEASGLYILIENSEGEEVYASRGAEGISSWDTEGTYLYKLENGRVSGLFSAEDSREIDARINEEGYELLKVSASAAEGSHLAESRSLALKAVRMAYTLRYWIYVIGLASLLVLVLSFIALMSVSGRRPGSEELYPGLLDRVPFDVLAAAAACLCALLFFGAVEFGRNAGDSSDAVIAAACGFAALVSACLGLGLCMSMASRIKQRTLISKSLIGRLLKLVWSLLMKLVYFAVHSLNLLFKLMLSIPLVWKTAAILSGIALLEIVCVASDREVGIVLLIMINAAVILAGIYAALCLRRLQKGASALAAGDLSHITDTGRMIWDFKKSGEDLNNIAQGMAAAVEERLKSERMKTELITNVSHDIKTPLTSIINYAGLIAKEECDNPTHAEYSEVLLRQSERMRRLLDDLIEASKASTGDLDVSLMPCDASVFLTQAAGEYEDKLKSSGLSLVTRVPQDKVSIMADGRRMQRVFDNLMNNICKYAQPGTRVYLTLEKAGDSAVISFKNTSREPLDLSEEELTERFVRGDHSRNTEGSGLGLSIAKSLAELQKGSLKLSVDGDLFKATLLFPAI